MRRIGQVLGVGMGAPLATHSGSGVAVSGAVSFVRYAFPPNYHGACGPADFRGLFEYAPTPPWTTACVTWRVSSRAHGRTWS